MAGHGEKFEGGHCRFCGSFDHSEIDCPKSTDVKTALGRLPTLYELTAGNVKNPYDDEQADPRIVAAQNNRS